MGVSMADGSSDILRDGSALLFGKGTHQREEKFAGAVHGVDVLPLKINRHSSGFQLADGREGIYGISGKTGQRFCENQIDFTSSASFTMRLKLSRLRMDKPETPSSVYIPAKTQSG